jgi:oligosaccharide repeat unit polymerase
MLNCLLMINLLGFILSNRLKMGILNPFKIYFLVWFLAIFGYYISRNTYTNISLEFVMLLFSVKVISFVLMFMVYSMRRDNPKYLRPLIIGEGKDQFLLIAQVVVTAALLLTYLKAVSLTGGEGIFTILGYSRLRLSMSAGGDAFGILKYFGILSFVVTSMTIFSFLNGKAKLIRLAFSIFVSLSYTYLTTGRTFILLLFCLTILPSMLVGAIRPRGILVSVIIISSVFIAISVMTAKGISTNNRLSENVQFFYEHIKGYTTAPIVAFSNLVESEPKPEWGENTFRFFKSLEYYFRITQTAPVSLIRDYTFVPLSINVYTVYDAYFRDFSIIGIFIPPFFLLIHYWLYSKASRYGGIWLFYYSASVYPLVMQFFEDQYLSLLSTWIQIAVWYWLFIKPPKLRISMHALQNA